MGVRGAVDADLLSRADLVADLRDRCGVGSGDILLIQAALRSIGRVEGGAATVVEALREAVGPKGTLVGYAATPENSETSRYYRTVTGGMGAAELARYRAAMTPFEQDSTPCSPALGRLSEQLRTTPGALRSSHPQTSFTALGARAEEVVANHPLGSHLGDDSPVGRLYEMGAKALLIGVEDWVCTAYHLAEYRVPWRAVLEHGCIVADEHGGGGRWVHFKALDLDDLHFPTMVTAVRKTVDYRIGTLGEAETFVLPIAESVDAAVEWLRENVGPGPMDPFQLASSM